MNIIYSITRMNFEKFIYFMEGNSLSLYKSKISNFSLQSIFLKFQQKYMYQKANKICQKALKHLNVAPQTDKNYSNETFKISNESFRKNLTNEKLELIRICNINNSDARMLKLW